MDGVGEVRERKNELPRAASEFLAGCFLEAILDVAMHAVKVAVDAHHLEEQGMRQPKLPAQAILRALLSLLPKSSRLSKESDAAADHRTDDTGPKLSRDGHGGPKLPPKVVQ